MATEQLFFQQNFDVRSYEVLPDKSIRLSQLINYLQDTAWNHTINMGVSINDLQAKDLTWVLSRKKLVVNSFPNHLDTVRVSTWPSGSEKFFFYRDFRIEDPSGKEIMKVTSTWLIFDMNTRKMVPVPDFLQSIPSNKDLQPMPIAREKLRPVTNVSEEFELTVMELDMDINRHTNNANYFQWILESMNKGRLKEMDIQFRGESKTGDRLRILTEKVGNFSYKHQIINSVSEETLVLATTEWS